MKKGKCIKRIRKHLLAFGCDVSNMTDNELEAGIAKASKIVGSFGVTVKEAVENLIRIRR